VQFLMRACCAARHRATQRQATASGGTIASAIMISSWRRYSIQQALEIVRDIHFAMYPAPNVEPYNEWAKTREARLSKIYGPSG
jgi:hypothetical protein